MSTLMNVNRPRPELKSRILWLERTIENGEIEIEGSELKRRAPTQHSERLRAMES